MRAGGGDVGAQAPYADIRSASKRYGPGGPLEAGERAINGSGVTIDLAGITEVDSTAVSLLLEWRRQATAAGRSIRYVNLPANLKSLAELYGVSELLGESGASM